MEKIVFRVIIVAGVCCLSTKHVHIQRSLTWADARKFCQANFINLSPLTSQLEEQVFRDTVGEEGIRGWIGLYWDQVNSSWKWSGGDIFSSWTDIYKDINSDDKLPANNLPTANNIWWTRNKWISLDGTSTHWFFCLNLTVVQQEKTWEEALEHCNENHSNFTSLLSKTENLLAMNEINKTGINERVWIGLRYLGDRWLWLNGDPLVYQAWSQGGDQDQLCPVTRRCGALTKNGTWENRDCQEKLPFICA
nr:secretory phospholipase A2 receptor-like [Nothobranchius furzeri]